MHNCRVILFIVIAGLFLTTGCATRNESLIRPLAKISEPGNFYHPTFNLKEYKSVQGRGYSDPMLTVVAAISGGGERSANLGAGVLIGLEELKYKNNDTGIYYNDALKEVDYFSTVSGGGMAVGAYISSMYAHMFDKKSPQPRNKFSFKVAMKPFNNAECNCRSKNVVEHYKTIRSQNQTQIVDPCLRRHLERGYHGNMLSGLKSPSLWFSTKDIGDVLEDTFSKEIMGKKWLSEDITLGDLFIAEGNNDNPELPLWICNATVIENGAIFQFTPDILKRYGIDQYIHNMEEISFKPSEQSKESFCDEVPVSLGMAASGSYPIPIPPRTLRSDLDPTNKYLHLTDGGISDNLGIITAINFLKQDKKNEQKNVLLVIDAYPGEFAPFSKNKSAPFLLTTLIKIPQMTLNSLRGRQDIFEYILKDTKVFYFNFDTLYRESNDNPYAEDPESVKALFYEIAEIGDLSQGFIEKCIDKKLTPFKLTRSVGTNYNISKDEQDFLIAAGQYVVKEQKNKIIKALGWSK